MIGYCTTFVIAALLDCWPAMCHHSAIIVIVNEPGRGRAGRGRACAFRVILLEGPRGPRQVLLQVYCKRAWLTYTITYIHTYTGEYRTPKYQFLRGK